MHPSHQVQVEKADRTVREKTTDAVSDAATNQQSFNRVTERTWSQHGSAQQRSDAISFEETADKPSDARNAHSHAIYAAAKLEISNAAAVACAYQLTHNRM